MGGSRVINIRSSKLIPVQQQAQPQNVLYQPAGLVNNPNEIFNPFTTVQQQSGITTILPPNSLNVSPLLIISQATKSNIKNQVSILQTAINNILSDIDKIKQPQFPVPPIMNS